MPENTAFILVPGTSTPSTKGKLSLNYFPLFSSDLASKKRYSPRKRSRKAGRMTRNAKPGLHRAVDGAMGAPQRFWEGSVIYNGKKVKIALYLAVFVTRDREGYVPSHPCKNIFQNVDRTTRAIPPAATIAARG